MLCMVFIFTKINFLHFKIKNIYQNSSEDYQRYIYNSFHDTGLLKSKTGGKGILISTSQIDSFFF